jgi:hypothetical protein
VRSFEELGQWGRRNDFAGDWKAELRKLNVVRQVEGFEDDTSANGKQTTGCCVSRSNDSYEYIEFQDPNAGWLELFPSAVRFSSHGLAVRYGAAHQNSWKQLNYLRALPPGLKLTDIPAFVRGTIAKEE